MSALVLAAFFFAAAAEDVHRRVFRCDSKELESFLTSGITVVSRQQLKTSPCKVRVQYTEAKKADVASARKATTSDYSVASGFEFTDYKSLIAQITETVQTANNEWGRNSGPDGGPPFELKPLPEKTLWQQPIYQLTINVKDKPLSERKHIDVVTGLNGRHRSLPHYALWSLRRLLAYKVTQPPPLLLSALEKASVSIIISANPDGFNANTFCSRNLLDGNLNFNSNVGYPDAWAWNESVWKTTGCDYVENRLAPQVLETNFAATRATVPGTWPVNWTFENMQQETKAIVRDLERSTPAGVLVLHGTSDTNRLSVSGSVAKMAVNEWWVLASARRVANAIKSQNGRDVEAKVVNVGDIIGGQTLCEVLQTRIKNVLCLDATLPSQYPHEMALAYPEAFICIFDFVSHIVDPTDNSMFGFNMNAKKLYTAAEFSGVSYGGSGLIDGRWDTDADGVADVADFKIDRLVSTFSATGKGSGLVVAFIFVLLILICVCALFCFCVCPFCRKFHRPYRLPSQMGGHAVPLPPLPALGTTAYDQLGLHPVAQTRLGDDIQQRDREQEFGVDVGQKNL